MRKTPIYIFIFSLIFGGCLNGFAQEKSDEKPQKDSIVYKERYGLRIGLDLSKPIRSIIDNQYNGLEINADYRITDRLFPAIELGRESYKTQENSLNAETKGEYVKIGVNYNAYNNWIGLQNELYVGLRYGFSTFSETLNDYTVYDKDNYFPPNYNNINQKFSSLNLHWIELQVGVKAEVLHNVFLGIHAELKRIVSEKEPDGFANLWIPGYNRNYDHSAFGIGWGYSISYLIPFKKVERKEKR